MESSPDTSITAPPTQTSSTLSLRVRWLDSALGPVLFGLAPYLLLILLSSIDPEFKLWLNIKSGATISAIFCFFIIATGYYLYGDDPRRLAAEDAQWATRLPSFLLPMQVTVDDREARSEVFRPYVGVDVDALEVGEVDLPDRLMRYGAWRGTSVMGIHSRDHLSASDGRMRKTLERLVRDGGMTGPMGKVWLFTMPTILGRRHINPFSVWFVYTPAGRLEIVILEIHHSYGPPASYVLHAADSEQASPGYSHSFTLPVTSATMSQLSTIHLQLVDPFSTPPTPTKIPRPIISLTLRCPTRHLRTVIAPSATSQVAPAPLRISRCGAVWLVLLQWPMSLIPAAMRERGVVSFAIDLAGEVEQWVTDVMARAGRWTWRGQGGLHTA